MIKALLLTGLLLAPAQTTAPHPDQSKLLENIRTRYDLPWRSGLTAFACTVQFDWIAHLTQSLHRPVPPTDPIVHALTTARTTLRVTPTGPTVSTTFQDPAPANGSAAYGLQHSLETILTSGIDAWLPFSTGSILPVGKTSYLILPTEDGYRIDLTSDEITGTLDLDPSYAIRHTDSRLKTGAVHLDTTFTPSPHGLQLTHLHTTTADPARRPTDTTLDLTYQPAGATSLPQTLGIQSRGGDLWTIRLSGCSTTP